MLGAAPAQAAPVNVTTDCAGLQAALTTAQANAQAGLSNTYTITLNGTCTEHYTLPDFPSAGPAGDYRFFTLRGDPDNGADGFDPATTGRALTGHDVHRLELQNLTFRDGVQTGDDGGAVLINGESSLGLRSSRFLHNHATGRGGAVFFTQSFPAGVTPMQVSLNIQESEFGSEATAAEGNSADGNGGAVAVESPGVLANAGINGSLFANNTAGGNGGGFDWVLTGTAVDNISLNNNRLAANKAGRSGGGAHVKIANATFLNIGGERYEGNSVEPITGLAPVAGDHFGGGLYVESGGSNIDQRQNVFTGNSVKSFTNGEDYGGGGEAIANTAPPAQVNPPTTNSELDRFQGNTVAGQANGSLHESEGGGLFFTGEKAVFRARLAVLAANTVGANGDGGGAYAGAPAPLGTLLDFNDSTVAGNTVGAGGSAPGLAGNGNDRLKLRNSIIWNVPKPDILGFSQLDIQFSDACLGTDTVPPGTGNICADPLLADAANGDIHQTGASPTVDKGDDDTFFAAGGEGPFTDFEGDPRPTDGDGDGHTVDMGADEGPAFIRPVVPIIPPGPVTSSGTTKAQCADAKDNDGDGAIDSQDPGCTTAADTNEGDESVRDLVLCGRRTISLVRADLRGGRVRLSGLVAAKVAKKPVTILANYGAAKGSAFTKRATVKPNSKGQFSATLPPPPKRLLTKARFQARVGTSRSVALKLPQSLASDSITKSGGSIVIRGKVDRAVLGKRNPVVIQRIVCGRYRTVGSAKPDSTGRYLVRFKAPALGAAALYRAQGQVLVRPGSKRYVRQFARALGITLTGQSG